MPTEPSAKKYELLEIKYFLLSELLDKFLEGNSKLHDIGGIVTSIERYGFRDPLSLDDALNDGNGGVSEGNGRLEALSWMYQDNPEKPPAYIKLTDSGEWAIPCVIGGNSKNEDEGIAYSLDHNSITLAGGTFTSLDISRLYNPAEYTATLEKLAKRKALPVTVDGSDLDLLVEMAKRGANAPPKSGDDDQPEEEGSSFSNTGYKGKFPVTLVLDEETHERWVEWKKRCDRERNESAFVMLLDEVGG